MTRAAQPPLPVVSSPGWWQRHWKWAVPLLCLVCTILFVGAIAGLMFVLFNVMRSSDVYTAAMQRARDNPQVIEVLGTPIEPRWYLSGEMNTSGASGEASLQIPLSGPKAEADLYVEAKKTAGRWHYSTLIVDVDGQQDPIDLLPEHTNTDASK